MIIFHLFVAYLFIIGRTIGSFLRPSTMNLQEGKGKRGLDFHPFGERGCAVIRLPGQGPPEADREPGSRTACYYEKPWIPDLIPLCGIRPE
jgi:hypothetical protein